MDKIIIHSELIDLSGQDIIDITNDETNILLYSDLDNINNIDDIFNTKNNVALLYQTEENFGHWVALIKKNNTIEFFDPYGLSVDEELKYSEYNLRTQDGQLVPHLTHLLNNSNYHIIINKCKLQKFKQDINTCGRHISWRIRMRDVELNEYCKLLTDNKHYNPDFWVSALTFYNNTNKL